MLNMYLKIKKRKVFNNALSHRCTSGRWIGPEILNGTLELLKLISEQYDFEYQLEEHHFGGAAIDNYGTPLSDKTLEACKMLMQSY